MTIVRKKGRASYGLPFLLLDTMGARSEGSKDPALAEVTTEF